MRDFLPCTNLDAMTAFVPDQVVVSGHFDSTGSTTSSRAPGAHGCASGVVAILEALRVIAAAKYKLFNMLEFHFFSREEGGLLGSRDVINSYVRNRVGVLAVTDQVWCFSVRGLKAIADG